MRASNLKNWHAIGWLVLLFVGACMMAASANAQTVTLAVEARSTDGVSVVPKLTWSTTPASSSCTASGDWSGAKPGSGTETLAGVTASKAYTLTCTWPGDLTCTIRWVNPTQNTNGSAYTNPGGTRIQWGRSATDLDQTAYNENPTATSWSCPSGMAAGTWWFTVRAYNNMGLESGPYTPPVSKTLTAAQQGARTVTVGFLVPATPTGVTAQ